MGFEAIFGTLRSSIVKHDAQYQHVRAHSTALLPYATSQDVLAAFKPRSAVPQTALDLLTVSLIAAGKTTSHSLWSSLLLAAYELMLRHLGSRLRLKNREDMKEAEAGIVLVFLEVVDSFPVEHPPARVALYLRRRVAEKFFAGMKREQRIRMESLEDEEVFDPNGIFGAAERLDRLVDVARVLQDTPEGADTLQLFLGTVACEESTMGYMHRTCGSFVGWSVYKEFCSRRTEAVAKVRSCLADKTLAGE